MNECIASRHLSCFSSLSLFACSVTCESIFCYMFFPQLFLISISVSVLYTSSLTKKIVINTNLDENLFDLRVFTGRGKKLQNTNLLINSTDFVPRGRCCCDASQQPRSVQVCFDSQNRPYVTFPQSWLVYICPVSQCSIRQSFEEVEAKREG